MAKSELYSNPLIPLVLIAGILSGSLWRSSAPSDTGKPGDNNPPADRSDGLSGTGTWVSTLRPVMESLDATLGGQAPSSTAADDGAGVVLASAGPERDAQVLAAMAGLRKGLDDIAGDKATCDTVATLQNDAQVTGGWLLAEDGGSAKLRATTARTLIDEYRDWRLFVDLASRTAPPAESATVVHPRYTVDFTVATVPDYVDSNSGWLADQGLAALQSGMAQHGYLFDRVKLIDWRPAAGSSALQPSSRLHERQPGAVIFRKVTGSTIAVHVVLLVLETPTAGVHQAALRNSLWFLRAWNACSKSPDRMLRVLGPSFSGSTVSLATVLGEDAFRAAFSPRIVITGSATASENSERMKTFSNGAIFRATVQPTAVLKDRMAAYLGSMRSGWQCGDGVALLNESNTTYGGDAGAKAKAEAPPESLECKQRPAFANAKVFNFPLHISQLRSDAPSLEQPGAFLSGPTVPLNMRESTPPSDLIPALRPQLTSPVVESTVDSILDAIRHEKLSAVGIFATDDRDALFLAREVKRASPDVQLFLFGTHSIYLHPDYIPYLRGALVASSYALTLANQPEIKGMSDSLHRQPFPSMSAEGAFYAIGTLMSLAPQATDQDYSLPYCSADVSNGCVPVPPVSINVIGEDGYWTLPTPAPRATAEASDLPPPNDLNLAPLPGVPVRFGIGALFVLMIVAAHLVVMFRIRRVVAHPRSDQSFLEWPVVRLLVPPLTFDGAGRYHALAVRICFCLLALAAAWLVAILLPFALTRFSVEVRIALLSSAVAATAMSVIYAGARWYGDRRRLAERFTLKRPDALPAARKLRLAALTGWFTFAGMVSTMVAFAILVGVDVWNSATTAEHSLTLARVVGGGIISPAALTVCLAAAFYTAMLVGVRRLSLVGYGYTKLAQGSSAFGLLSSENQAGGQARKNSLAALLDMPAMNLPPIYPAFLLIALAVAVWTTRHVTTVDGQVFSWFVMLGTWTTLCIGMSQLVQGLALWNSARSHLKRLAHAPIEQHLHDIAPHVPWDISLAPPRLTELMPVARMADYLLRDFRRVAAGTYGSIGPEAQRGIGDREMLGMDVESRLGIRPGDLKALKALFAEPSHVRKLEDEMGQRQHAAIIQSETWFDLWKLADALVTMLQRTTWCRSATATPSAARRHEVEVVEIADLPGVPLTAKRVAELALRGHGDGPMGRRSGDAPVAWFTRCEQLVALQMAFVLRDIVARTVTCLFAAMLCLTFLTAAHLLYVFSGRTALLTIDMLAIAAAAIGSLWILVDMERDHVLSRLRTTTPGRVDFNWEFIKRVAVYGVLPLLAVIAALFPEVGGTLFGWLEPLRKLSSF